MQPYNYFGESSLFNESIRKGSAIAEVDVLIFITFFKSSKTTVLAMTTDSLSAIVGNQFHEVLYRNLHLWTIEKTKYLKQLTKI